MEPWCCGSVQGWFFVGTFVVRLFLDEDPAEEKLTRCCWCCNDPGVWKNVYQCQEALASASRSRLSWHKAAKVRLAGSDRLWDTPLIILFVTMINVLLECWDFCFCRHWSGRNTGVTVWPWQQEHAWFVVCCCYWVWPEDQIDHLQDHFELNRKDF